MADKKLVAAGAAGLLAGAAIATAAAALPALTDPYRSAEDVPDVTVSTIVNATGARIRLKDGHCTVLVNGHDNSIKGAPHGRCAISVSGTLPIAGFNRIGLAGGGNRVTLAPAAPAPIEIGGFVPGSDRIGLPTVAAMKRIGPGNRIVATILRDPGIIDGAGLGNGGEHAGGHFRNGPFILDLGVQGDASPETAAAALAKRYVPSGLQASSDDVGENLVILAQSLAGDTEIYEFAAWAGSPRALPGSPVTPGGRITSAHLRHLATLQKVRSADLSAADFQ